MGRDAHDFCRLTLREVRRELAGQRVPRRLTALRAFRDNWLVEGDGGFAVEVVADCAFEARSLALQRWEGDQQRARDRDQQGRLTSAAAGSRGEP